MSPPTGTLWCVPTPIASDRAPADDLPGPVLQRVAGLDYLIAESPRTARAFLKQLTLSRPIQSIEITTLDEHTPDEAIDSLLAPLLAGRDAGLVSEAGCPGVADPGARLVLAAHAAGIPVMPLAGPSAILLALMGSGLDGQRFGFVGYLPTDPEQRRRRLRELEQRSRRDGETIVLIETPYRNQAMLEALLGTLQPSTWLCVAADLTGLAQRLATERVRDWRTHVPTLARVPTVFVLRAA